MNLDRKKLRGQKKAFVKNNSPIHRLDPFLEEGILRVGGRLKRADLPHETKHPAILPQKSHVTTYSSATPIKGGSCWTWSCYRNPA